MARSSFRRQYIKELHTLIKIISMHLLQKSVVQLEVHTYYDFIINF